MLELIVLTCTKNINKLNQCGKDKPSRLSKNINKFVRNQFLLFKV